MVNEFKETYILSLAPDAAAQALRRHAESGSGECWLDASVDTINNPHALFTIKENIEEHRVIVCVRNQLDRAFSAFRFFREMNARRLDPSVIADIERRLNVRWLDQSKRFADGDRPPRYLRTAAPHGHYLHSIFSTLNEEAQDQAKMLDLFDRRIERFLERTFSGQVRYELHHLHKHGRFPKLSVLGSSFYATTISRALSILDPERVMIVSTNLMSTSRTQRALSDFIGRSPVAHAPTFPCLNRSVSSDVDRADVEAARSIIGGAFDADSRKMLASFTGKARPNLDLFDEGDLFWAEDGQLKVSDSFGG